MRYETLSYDVADGVATITLDRLDKHNAVSDTMARELPVLWQQFAQDDSAQVAILTGAGEKAFCVGADMAEVPQLESGPDGPQLRDFRWTALQNNVWKPVICAVNGMAVGGGLHFVADSDVVLASDTASFFDTHVRVGLVAGLEPVTLARKMPMEAVLRMMLLGGGERMDAATALRLGLVGEVVPPEQLLPRARQLADIIKGNSPAAMARTKQAIWRGADQGLDQALESAWALIMAHNDHPDLAEGQRAFLEKRAPQWQPLGGEAL
jgi:enoyl-CoA hydratase/carnithine racemase